MYQRVECPIATLSKKNNLHFSCNQFVKVRTHKMLKGANVILDRRECHPEDALPKKLRGLKTLRLLLQQRKTDQLNLHVKEKSIKK